MGQQKETQDGWLFFRYIRTWVRVSGRRNPTSPPHTSTVEASRMGIALVMLTREPNIKFPRTAAALHSAFKKPKPVALQRTRDMDKVEKASSKSPTLDTNVF